MKKQAGWIPLTCVLLAAVFASSQSLGQADPEWLRSWDDSQKNKPATLSPVGRIASEQEPGVPLVIAGLVVTPNGLPAADVVVHSYHRDRNGFDFGPNDKASATWRLQGWAKTDSEGRFEFRTIRPAADHLGREAAHVHFTVESDTYGRQWAPKVFLADDPLVTVKQRQKSNEAGEYGSVRPVEIVDDIQRISVAIRLKKQADF
ncbi:MAG: hypothetical protein AAGH76_08890 [Pseudomonadota bacterium]